MRLFVLLLIAPFAAPVGQVMGQYVEPLRRPALGSYDVVALRVEFQPDTTRFTTGDGTFSGDLYGGLTPSVDPLPHDARYFQAHLDFLSNYVHHVSDGAATVRTHLLPEIVQVSGTMGAYAPTGFDANAPEQLSRLARLADEAWTLADARMQLPAEVVDPERTVFLVFHAGVGRDIELTGTVLDRTPEDLPSLFFGEERLAELLPDASPQFDGMPVRHALILPRTETRRGTDFIADEPFLVEISINGMLAASFFNFLGVPDLFDTASGRSAIGPFGLMDPLGIFAYGGLLPPEPSAWTRYFLGWADPTDVSGPDSIEVALATSSRFGTSDLARVWVSETEYFLVENRHRDPEGDGLRLTIRSGEHEEVVVFQNGQEGFTGPDISAFPGGVVVAADNYDWALPGGLDENGNELNGGILIWHVNEGIVRSSLVDNRVNANPSRRGIDLEEADSAQDLGYPSGNPFAPQADLGSPFDFWYEGNPVRVLNQVGQEISLYKNRFGPDTYPNSNSTDGGASFVVLEGFSRPAAEMTFRYREGTSDLASPVRLTFDDELGGLLESRNIRPLSSSIWHLDDHVIVDVELAPGDWLTVVVDPEGDLTTIDAVASSSRFGSGLVYVAPRGNERVLLYRQFGGEEQELAEMGPGEVVVGPLVVVGERVFVLLDSGAGAVLLVADATTASRTPLPQIGRPIGLTGSDRADAPGAGVVAFGDAGAVVVGGSHEWAYILGSATGILAPAFGIDAAGVLGTVPDPAESRFLSVGPNGALTTRSIDAGHVASSPVLADVTGDGNLDVLIAADSLLLGYARTGAIVPGFPIRLRGAASGALAIAADADGSPYVFIGTTSGVIEGFTLGDGRFVRIPGFPLPVGSEVRSISLEPGRGDSGDQVLLYAMTQTGRLHAWQVDGLESVVWAGKYGDAFRTSFARAGNEDGSGDQTDARLLVASETYNWPNPIRDGLTHIRWATREESSVVITIIDGAGRMIDEIPMGTTPAGVPFEIPWQTDAESGLYFARISATSTTGRSDSRLVRMAVIR